MLTASFASASDLYVVQEDPDEEADYREREGEYDSEGYKKCPSVTPRHGSLIAEGRLRRCGRSTHRSPPPAFRERSG